MKENEWIIRKSKYGGHDLVCEELAKCNDTTKFQWRCYVDVLLKDGKTRLSLINYVIGKSLSYRPKIEIERKRKELLAYLKNIEKMREFTHTVLVDEYFYVNGKWVEPIKFPESDEDFKKNKKLREKALAVRVIERKETYFTTKNPFRKLTSKFPTRLK